jgi:hypothetical protein
MNVINPYAIACPELRSDQLMEVFSLAHHIILDS